MKARLITPDVLGAAVANGNVDAQRFGSILNKLASPDETGMIQWVSDPKNNGATLQDFHRTWATKLVNAGVEGEAEVFAVFVYVAHQAGALVRTLEI